MRLVRESVLQLALHHVVVVEPAVGTHHNRLPITATQAHRTHFSL